MSRHLIIQCYKLSYEKTTVQIWQWGFCWVMSPHSQMRSLGDNPAHGHSLPLLQSWRGKCGYSPQCPSCLDSSTREQKGGYEIHLHLHPRSREKDNLWLAVYPILSFTYTYPPNSPTSLYILGFFSEFQCQFYPTFNYTIICSKVFKKSNIAVINSFLNKYLLHCLNNHTVVYQSFIRIWTIDT